MQNLKFSIGIITVLCLSRFIPHPPNFTALIALSFYIPALFGKRYVLAIIAGLLISDIILGLHKTMIFTFLTVFLIGIFSIQFRLKLITRLIGCFSSAILFFIISNFGVWTLGVYGYSAIGLLSCYIAAIPFFYATLLSTFLYAILFELLLKLNLRKFLYIEKI